MIELLKAQWTIKGLEAPIFAWLAAGALLAGTLYFLIKLSWLVHRECRIHRNITRRLEAIRIEHGVSPGKGLSGAGLLFTFLAILVALLDVRIADNRVLGMENLIHGLSGKFVSSIAALFATTLFLLREKPLFHRLANSRQRLVSAIDALIPRLSPAWILADLQQDISEQSIAFRHFNADLSTKLRQGFSESMGPTLQGMVTTIEDLSQLLRAAEVQRQDSITGSLGDLLRRLEQSITTALGEMSDRFTESLSGSARQEFDQVINSLGGTARLLEGMNVQFQTTQSALNELVNFARNSTAEQIESLTTVLHDLMKQLHETAG